MAHELLYFIFICLKSSNRTVYPIKLVYNFKTYFFFISQIAFLLLCRSLVLDSEKKINPSTQAMLVSWTRMTLWYRTGTLNFNCKVEDYLSEKLLFSSLFCLLDEVVTRRRASPVASVVGGCCQYPQHEVLRHVLYVWAHTYHIWDLAVG